MPTPRARRSWWTAVSAILLAGGLLSPLIILGAHRFTLTGMAEESTGYRYFYSLRNLYGQGEHPWLPQGQFPGLTHVLLQVGLTLAGFSPTQLFPRIDLFAYSAAALPHLFAVAAFIWMARAGAMPGISSAAVSGLVVLTFLSIGSPPGYTLVLPDYLSWAEPVALITAGWLLRLDAERDRPKWRSDVRLGVFAGLCLSIKPTYVVFVVPIAVWTVLTIRPIWRALVTLLSAAVIAVATWITVLYLYNLGDISATLSHFIRLNTFVSGISPTTSLYAWLTRPALWMTFTPTSAAVLMPIVLALSVAFLPGKSLSGGLLAGSVLSLYVAYRRSENQTLVEVNGYFVTAVIVWSAAVAGPVLNAIRARWWPAIVRVFMILVTAALWVLAAGQVQLAAISLLPVFGTADAGARELSQCLAARTGRTLFLIPDNNYRPTTVDSAIFKGGSDIDRYYWGASPYVRDMFPDRGYLVGATSGAIDPSELDAYSKIVFVSLPGAREEAVQRLKALFAVPVDQFDCSCTIDFKYHIVNACYRRPT